MKNNKYKLILAAAIIGILNVFISGAAFLFLIFGSICYHIYRKSPEEDKKFVLSVIMAGFLLRVLLAVSLHAITYLKGYHCISGDDLLYTVRAWALVYEWEGKPYGWVCSLASTSATGVNPFTVILAVFYKLFGFHPVTGKIINCIIGALIGWVSYLIGRRIFNNRIAKIAMLIVTFYPSLVRWSVANLKDPLLIISFLACVYTLIYFLNNRVTVWRVILMLVFMVPLYFFTHMLFLSTIGIGVIILLFLRILSCLKRRRLKAAVVLLAAFLLAALISNLFYTNSKVLIEFLFKCETKQSVICRSDFAGYRLYDRNFMEDLSAGRVSLLKFLDLQFRSVVYFMLAPFPWQMLSKSRLVSMPQMFLWYMMLAFSMVGFARLMLRRPREALLIGTLLTFAITIYSIAEGNIGSAFRHRDVFTPFFIILASCVISDLIEDIRCRNSSAGRGVEVPEI